MKIYTFCFLLSIKENKCYLMESIFARLSFLYTLLCCYFLKNIAVFSRPKLNILIFLPILGPKYSCEYSKVMAYDMSV